MTSHNIFNQGFAIIQLKIGNMILRHIMLLRNLTEVKSNASQKDPKLPIGGDFIFFEMR